MLLKRKEWAFFGLSLISLLLTLLPVSIVSAVSVGSEFVDAATIKVNNIEITQADYDSNDMLSDEAKRFSLSTLNSFIDDQAQGAYTDVHFDDSEREYVHANNDCDSRIKYQGGEWQLVALHIRTATGGCSGELLKKDIALNIAHPEKLQIKFRWVNQNTMVRVDGRDGDFREEDPVHEQNFFVRVDNNSGEVDYVKLISGNTIGEYFVNGDSKGQVSIADAQNRSNAGTPPGTASNGAAGTTATCESEGASLSWIICPVLYMGDAILRKLDQAVIGLLSIPNDYYTNPDLKNAWSRVRNIAYILLVPVMLIMVISTALGFDFISAYTVKKALPRLVAAVIFIAVSFELTKFMIIITNDVGKSIHGLIIGAFTGADSIGLDTVFSPNNSDSIVGIPFAGLAVTGALAVGSIGIVLSYILIGIVALAIGFFLLSFRQMLLIALVLFAPLAILAWIFPGNDKLWKLWWGTFSKLLLLFPLIMLLIAVGKSFALLVATEDGSLVSTLLKLVAYVGPYFLIPATFKFAGGTFASIAGMANNRGRGLFDRQKKYRSETRAALRERAGSNNRFNPNNRLVKRLRLNSMASWGADPMSNLAYHGRNVPGLSGKGQRIKSAIEGSVSDQSGKLFEELNNKYKFNDKAFRALSGSHAGFSEETKTALREANLYGKAPTTLQGFQAMSSILANSSDATEQVAANVLGAATGRLTSLYTDPEMGKASIQGAGLTGLSAHGFADGEDLAYVGNDMMNKGMSSDLTQALVSGAQVVGQRQRPDIKAGYGTVFKDGKFVDGMSDEGGRAEKLIGTLTSGDLAQAKAGSIKKLRPTIEKVLKGGGGQATAVQDQLFSWAGPYSQASVAVKEEALNIISANPSLAAEFERRKRAETDPTRRGQGGPQESGEDSH